MVTASKESQEQILIQIGEEVIELTGADKEAFIAQREKDQLEIEALKEAKETQETERQTKLDSAITKLKALGLTESEAKIIIGLE
jgi:hypothetical protein